MELKIKRRSKDAVLPKYMSEGAGAFDLVATKGCLLLPGASKTVSTGIAMEIPKGFTGIICPRSGMGVKHDIDSHMGIIDSDYRGEVKIHLRNLGYNAFGVQKGDRVAQMVIIPTPPIEIVEADELSETVRGEGGFGHTGK